MLKIYKRTIHIGQPERIQRLNSTEYYAQEKSISQRISKIVAVPAMIAGAILGTFCIFCRAFDFDGNHRLQSLAIDEKRKTTSHSSKH
ncbi:hypothetical protein [Methylomonas lenta]|uniref:hypothetical protein n=1 Tax=Methylomonas lenta TaxID=980561 RepID=UPI000A44A3F4|nr:hypothetical protein [Methylomonas lenta]